MMTMYYNGEYVIAHVVKLNNGEVTNHDEAWRRYGELVVWCRNQDIPFQASQMLDHFSLPGAFFFLESEHAVLFKLTFRL